MTWFSAPAGAQKTAEPEDLSSSEPDLEKHGLSLSSAVDYSVGRYGSHVTTQILVFPQEVDWWLLPERADIKLTVPYIWQHGLGVVARLGIGTQAPNQRAMTTSGPGDVLLEGGYVIFKDENWTPEVRLFTELKFPTASSAKALGTGKFDGALGTNLSKSVTDVWTALLDLSYSFIGSPSGIPLRNIFAWSAGMSWEIMPSLQLAGYMDGATAAERDISGALDVRAEVEYKVTPRAKLTSWVSAGLTNGAPAFAIMSEFSYRFWAP